MKKEIEKIENGLNEIKNGFTELTRLKMDEDVRKHLMQMWEKFRTVNKLVGNIKETLENPSIELPSMKTTEKAKTSNSESQVNELKSQKTPNNDFQDKPKKSSNGNMKKLLIIDDCKITQNILNYTLSKGGVDVTSLTDSSKALEMVREIKPDIILLDLMMPKVNGFEVLKVLRSSNEFDDIKIIVGSNRSYDKDRLAVLEGGANDFIAKPYNIKELALRIRNFLGLSIRAA